MNTYISAATKVRAMFGGILNEKVYDDLIAEHNVSDIAAYLKSNTVYKEVLNGVTPGEVHRRNLEILLKKQSLLEMQRIYKNIVGDTDFFYDFNLDYELEILKDIIRDFLTDDCYVGEYQDLVNSVKFKFPIKKFIEAHNIDELIFILKKEKIMPFLTDLLSDKNSDDIHTIENNIDTYYFENVMASAKKHFSGKELEFILEFIGTKADLYNIELIFKAKKFYHWKPDTVVPYTISIHNKLTADEIYSLISCETLNECFEKLKKTPYKDLAKDEDFDILVKKHYMSRYIHEIRKSVDLRAILYYFQLKSIDISNITTITESVRYNYSKATTKQFLVYKGM